MGIKGIYGEIGPGRRVALAKLAVDTFEEKGRPLRIAVDISIWQFQIQAGKGGANPALRTLYYRLLRLLSLCVQPLFVFDGKHKPPFKRNKRTVVSSVSLTEFYTKKLLELFGFPFHVAPGEAEAECALFQREGIVDAVFSEDVDTLMFGCSKTLRNWSSAESRGNHAPTHVSIYDAKVTLEGKSGLDREGMILVALMSGGDYITEGIPGCGIKLACEAARAGYGKSLCRLSKKDTAGLEKWRDELTHELQSNENKYFRTKHKALQVPSNFPNIEVLGYYTHPIVSSAAKLIKLKEEIRWDRDIDIIGLRHFVGEAFQWTYKTGAIKFVRGLAPALLILRLLARATRQNSHSDDLERIAVGEMKLVKAICGRRQHFSADGTPELRIVYHPAELVGLDPDAEVDEKEDYGRDGLTPITDDEDIQRYHSGNDEDESERTRSKSPKKATTRAYNSNDPEKIWIPESIAKVGIPLLVEDYEELRRNPHKFIRPKFTGKKVINNGWMPNGALEPYLTISKPCMESLAVPISKAPPKILSIDSYLPPVHLAPSLKRLPVVKLAEDSGSSRPHKVETQKILLKQGKKSNISEKALRSDSITRGNATGGQNPWTIAQNSSPTSSKLSQPLPHSSKPGLIAQRAIGGPKTTDTPTEVPQITYRSTPSPSSSSSLFKNPTCSGEVNKRHKNSSTAHAIELPAKSFHYSKLPAMKTSVSKPLGERSRAPKLTRMREIIPGEQEIIDISSSPIATSQYVIPSYGAGEPLPPALQTYSQNIVEEKEKRKRFVMLRESLEGSWKEIGEDELISAKERGRSRAWRKSTVEVVDMTESCGNVAKW